jgi:subtilisin family serine protease
MIASLMIVSITSVVSGAGLVTTVTGSVNLLAEPRLVVDTTTIFTDEETGWSGSLTGFPDLRTDMTVMATVVWQENGSLLATEIELLGVGNRVMLAGYVIDRETAGEPLLFQIETGEWIAVYPDTVQDGDQGVIGVSRFVTVECVPEPGPSFLLRALWLHLSPEGRLSFDENPWSVPGGEATYSSQAIVVLVDGADPVTVAERHGATVLGTLSGSLVHLFAWQEEVSLAILTQLNDDPEVEDAEPNWAASDQETVRRRNIAYDRTPSAAKYTGQRAVRATDTTRAHQLTTGAGTLVAVIDTGVDPYHPLLRHRIEPGWDFVDNDARPWETSDGIDQDQDQELDEAAGHGTFVAGLVLLVAPAAKIVPYRVFNDDGQGNEFAVCQAVLAAMDRGVDVINLSFVQDARPRVLDEILDEASRRGIVLVSGAGNGVTDGSGPGPTNDLPFPADDHRVLGIAAVGADGTLADFSNYGPEVALAAPGVDLYSGGILRQFGTWEGTSMAAPLVSGAVALLRSLEPRLGPQEIEAALLQSALPAADGGPGLLQVGAALDLLPVTASRSGRRH